MMMDAIDIVADIDSPFVARSRRKKLEVQASREKKLEIVRDSVFTLVALKAVASERLDPSLNIVTEKDSLLSTS